MVSVRGESSDHAAVRSGVPQGSVLGPLLFILYVNDFSTYMDVACVLFADDTTLINSDVDLTRLKENSQSYEEKAGRWFGANQLQLNNQKTQKLVISTNNTIIDKHASVTLLGIGIDPCLSWKTHKECLVNKLARNVYLLRRLSAFVSPSVLKTAYYGVFHPHLLYGISLWGNSTEAIRVFKMQKKAVRILAKAGYRDHCAELFIYTQT